MHAWKGRGFVMVRAVTANLVSKDARDFKEKSHETARWDLLALRTYRAKCLGGGGVGRIRPPAFLGLRITNIGISKLQIWKLLKKHKVWLLIYSNATFSWVCLYVCVSRPMRVCAFVRTFNWGHAWVFLQATGHTHHTGVMPGFPGKLKQCKQCPLNLKVLGKSVGG